MGGHNFWLKFQNCDLESQRNRARRVAPWFFRSCFAHVFASLHGVVPPKAVWKILLFLGPRFEKIFGSELLFFWCLRFVEVFWRCFAKVFVLLDAFVLSKAVWKILLSLGLGFAENFRERTFGFRTCARSMFFGAVLPMFLLRCVVLFSRKLSEPFSSTKGRVSRKIFGNELLVLTVCAQSMLSGAVSPRFLLCCMPLFSRKLSDKVLLSLGPGFAENFRERTFGFWFWCSVHVFWSCFANCFCFLAWRCYPESCLKKFSYS